MLRFFLLFITIIIPVFAGYHCRSPTKCTITCSNYSPNQLHTLAGTDWIAVPYDTGTCYFHNTKTREDTGSLPVNKNLRRINNQQYQYQ